MEKKRKIRQPVDDFAQADQLTPPTVDPIQQQNQAAQPTDDYPFGFNDKASFSDAEEDHTPASIVGMETDRFEGYPDGKKMQHKDRYQR